ncbi:MAG: hypothetical protein V8S34_05660 [Lawsonibacter sp.]
MADLEKTAVTTADASPIDAEKGAEIMEKYEKESRTRKFQADWLNKLVYCPLSVPSPSTTWPMPLASAFYRW